MSTYYLIDFHIFSESREVFKNRMILSMCLGWGSYLIIAPWHPVLAFFVSEQRLKEVNTMLVDESKLPQSVS